MLEQANQKQGPGWKAWEQGPAYKSAGLPAMRGCVAAREQGAALCMDYVLKVLDAKHTDNQDIKKKDTLIEAARTAGLDVARFEADMTSPDSLKQVAREHESAVENGIFGTPTLVFEDGTAAYLKMHTPPEQESVAAFEHIMWLARGRTYFGELKRPQPPWPGGLYSPTS